MTKLLQNKIFALSSVAIFLFSVALPLTVNAQSIPCDIEIFFDVVDSSGKSLRKVPTSGTVNLFIRLNTIGNCPENVFVNRVVFNQMVKGSPSYIADAQVSGFRIRKNEVLTGRLSWQVSGLKDQASGSTVTDGSKIGFQGAILKSEETNYRASSTVEVSVGPETSGGSGGTTAGGTGTGLGGGSGGTTAGGTGTGLGGGSGTGTGLGGGSGSSGGGTIDIIHSPIKWDSLPEAILGVINLMLRFIAGIAVVVIIYGGVRMVASAGSPDGVKAGKESLKWAILGLITALMAFAMVSLVQSLLGYGL